MAKEHISHLRKLSLKKKILTYFVLTVFGLTMLMMAILVVILAYFLIRRQSGLNMPTAPVTVSRSGDVQSEFLIRVSLALLVLMVPLGVFHIVWRDYLGLTLVLIGGFAAVSVYLLARANRLKAAALVMMPMSSAFCTRWIR